MGTHETQGSFEIDMSPGEPLLDGTGRLDFTKTWDGGFVGTGRGLLVSGGDPQSGNAGYVAFETVEGELDGRRGGFALHQFGTMSGGSPTLSYAIVPGSGTGDLTGISGTIDLDIVDGHHEVTIRYSLA